MGDIIKCIIAITFAIYSINTYAPPETINSWINVIVIFSIALAMSIAYEIHRWFNEIT